MKKIKINNNFLNQSRELQNLSEKVLLLDDKYLRLYSEFENFKKRSIKKRSILINDSNKFFLLKFISVLEDFERAFFSLSNNSKSIFIIKDGVYIIYSNFFNILSKEGVVKMFIEKGDDLNHEQHEVINQILVKEKKLKGKIISVVENGYFFKKKVIKFAKVVIGI